MAYNNTFNKIMNYTKEQSINNPSNINKIMNGTYEKSNFENKLTDYTKSVTKGLVIAALAGSMAYNTACGGGGKTGTDENGNELFAALVANFNPAKQSVNTNVFNELGDGATRDNVTYVATLENQGNVPVTISKIGKARQIVGFEYSDSFLKGYVGEPNPGGVPMFLTNTPLQQNIGVTLNPGGSMDLSDTSRTLVGGDGKEGLGIFYQSQLGQDCEPVDVRVNTVANPKFAEFTERGFTQKKEYDENGFKPNTSSVAVKNIEELCDETLY